MGLIFVILQVWESTPGSGQGSFADTVWQAVDEVSSCCCPKSVSNDG